MNNSTVFVNPDTGEALRLVPISGGELAKRRGKKREKSPGFTQVWLDDLLDYQISAGARRTLDYLAARMDKETGEVFFEIPPMMKALGYAHAPAVSKLISELVLVELAERTKHSHVRLNPNIVWRGTAEARSIAMFHWLQTHRENDAEESSDEG